MDPLAKLRATAGALLGGADRAALRESAERERAILETALDCIIVIDHTGAILEFNPAAERTFGYTRAEAMGNEMADLIIPPHLRERHRHGLARATATGQDTIAGRRIEITAIRKNGEEFPVELAITRIAIEGSEPLFTGHIRDITVRRRTEARQTAQYAVTRVLADAATLHEATPRLLEAVCESLGWDLGAIWKVDTESGDLHCVDLWRAPSAPLGEFEDATRGATLQLGEGLPGRIWQAAAPLWIADVTQDGNFPRTAAAADCGLRGAFGFPIRLGENVLGVVEFFSREIRQPDDELLEMFTAIGSQLGQFIERRRAEGEIRALNADLERRIRERTMELAEANLRLLETLEREQELGQLKSNFVSLVSHEFRTPLGVILSSSEILQLYFSTLDEGERGEQLEAIKTNVLRMSAMMEEVLLFSRLEAGKLACQPEPLDLGGLGKLLADEMRSATHARCVIEWRTEGDLDGAHADETVLRHIFTNLLSNAVKYSPPGTRVCFLAQRLGNDAVFQVSDCGIGIPADAQKRLFDAFYRASNASDYAGTGLGLVIVKRCVSLHGGTITIESVEGTGTTVQVTLPLFSNHSS